MLFLLNSLLLLSLTLAFGQSIPSLTLNNGHNIPIVGFGTSAVDEKSIREAIDAGYRHIDTSLYYNDSELFVGTILKEMINKGNVKREDFFIVSKLEADYHERSRVPEGIKQSLKRLQLDYLDMYLVHAPASTNPVNVSLSETWQGMSDVLRANLTRSIGVSNFKQHQIDEIIGEGGVVPVTNQVISNPYWTQNTLLSYLNQHNITLTAFSPLDGYYPNLLKDPKLIEIAKKHNVSAAQVTLRYQIQRNVIVIPKANNPKHIKENMDLFNFKLNDQDMSEIGALDKQ